MKHATFLTRVDEVIYYLWDPVGVSDEPDTRDKYKNYADHIFLMITREDAGEEEIIKYLLETETEITLLPPTFIRAIKIAKILIELRDKCLK